MPNFKPVVHFLLVDFGGGYLLVTFYLLLVICDGGKTKSDPSPDLLGLDCQTGLEFDNCRFINMM